MAAKTISMEPLKQAIQLHQDGISISEIARRLGIARNTVKKYLRRVPGDELPKKMPEPELAVHLYQTDHKVYKDLREQQLFKHFELAVTDLRKTGVNKLLLHEEYLLCHPDGYKYSQYCFHFNNFLKKREVVMHLDHTPADQLMIDFAGKRLQYVHPGTGEVIECQVFVAVLPHSGLTFCYAVHSQKIPDFIEAIAEALCYCGGSPLTILCDNLRSAVTRSCKVEPAFTDACYQLSNHYNTTFSATRPYHPRDKAMVERCVNIVYAQVFARLRGSTFTSLAELNAAIMEKMDALNNKLYKGSSFSRRQLFEQNEQRLLKPLPAHSFSIKSVSKVTVQSNYHIELRSIKEYFSVPYLYAGKRVNALWDNHSVEIYLDACRIALHSRTNRQQGRYNTLPEHMPAGHLHASQVKGLTGEKLQGLARKTGRHALQVITQILQASVYPQQAFKTCNAILLLQKQYDKERLEAACAHALAGTRLNYHSIKAILKSGQDKQPLLFDTLNTSKKVTHENIRGAANYQ